MTTGEALIRIGPPPEDVAYDSGKGELFVANEGANNVSVISDVTNTVVATISVGSRPNGVAYDSGKGEVFVTNGGYGGSSEVSEISNATNTVMATSPMRASPVDGP